MFGLFKRGPKPKSIKYFVYRTEIVKYKLLVDEVRKLFKSTKHVLVICFFEDTFAQIEKLSVAAGISGGDSDTKFTLAMAEDNNWQQHGLDTQLVLAEVSPTHEIMEEIISNYKGEKDIVCHTSADNALFNIITAGRLTSLLDTLNVGELDVIQHKMVDKSIEAAQKKMAEAVLHPKPASSLEEWVKINMDS